jgi:inorganic pyrophosphatase
MHPWHDVPWGRDPTEWVHAVIEIPEGSKVKYELDKPTGLLRADRVLYSAVRYPANYGFIPRTYCGDGDPLDVLLLCQSPLVPLALARCRPVGVIAMRDEQGADDKIIGVHVDDPQVAHYRELEDLPPHVLAELKRFFQDYKALEGKDVEVGELRGRAAAETVVRAAIDLYRAHSAELRSRT